MEIYMADRFGRKQRCSFELRVETNDRTAKYKAKINFNCSKFEFVTSKENEDSI